MSKVNITSNLVPISYSIKAAMHQLNQGVGGILLCVNEEGVVLGVLTDGDIRRAFLGGAKLDDLVVSIMNRDFTHGYSGVKREENLKLLNSVIQHVPILDKAGKPVDMLSWSQFLSLPITTPSLGGNELKYVADCIETVWISSQGGYVGKFQDSFEKYHNGGTAICTSSGTAALHLALLALGIGQGDEVIVPNITFGATANVVIHVGARPVFVDVDIETYTLDIKAMQGAINARTKAIIPVHLYGHPCDMDPILKIAEERGLKVIEDCAEALGAEYKGQKVGLLGDVGCFSFFANKVITTGEGGMVLTKDQSLIDRISLYRDHGMSKERKYWHIVPGFNYRMTNLQAAVGLAQLERINDFLNQRDRIVRLYNSRLRDIAGLNIPRSAPWARNVHWLYSITLDSEILGIGRDELARKLSNFGIETRPVFPTLNGQPAYGSKRGSFPVSEFFANNGLSLPTGNTLTESDVDRVCDVIASILR